MPAVHRVDRLEDLPSPTPAGADYVMVDVILASTAIVRLLEAGARHVRPFVDREEALAYREREAEVVLVGERDGEPIEGFDLPPLPTLIAEADLAGRPVGLVTSNGTRVVDRVGSERPLFVGCPANGSAVAGALRGRDRPVWLVAAGRRGTPTPEDTAGVELLAASLAGSRGDGAVREARSAVRTSGTARWLAGSGLEDDLADVLRVDSSDVVPVLRDGVFVPAG